MESTDLEVLRAAVQWLDQGHSVTLVTVAETWSSSPRPAGSLMVLRADGRMTGSVSGGCLEQDLLNHSRARTQRAGRPDVLTYGVTREQANRVGLPCGGRVALVLEPLGDPDDLRGILQSMDSGELVARRVHLETGEVSRHPAHRDQGFFYDGRILEKVFGPAWRLIIVGAGQLSRYVAEMALALDYHVTVCDPREDYLATWKVPGVELDNHMPDEAVKGFALDKRSALVVLTHDPNFDDLALLEAADSGAFYIGALGSKANHAKRRRRLAYLGASQESLDRIHGPVGLPIGGRTPPEIAVAILAELTAIRYGRRLQRAAGEAGESEARSEFETPLAQA